MGLFPLDIEENGGNRIPQAPGSVGATALSGLSIYSPKPSKEISNNSVTNGELFSPVSPKSDFNAYVDNTLSPLGIGMSPTPSELANRVPTSKDWSISQSPFVGGFPANVAEEFAFSDVGSPPPRMRHKAKRFDETSSPGFMSPSNLMMSPLGSQDQSHLNNKKALAHRMKGSGDHLKGQLNNSSQLFLNPVKTDLLSGNSPSKHKLGIAESSESLGFAAITEAARSIKQKPSGSSKKNNDNNLKDNDKINSNSKTPRKNLSDDDIIRGSIDSTSDKKNENGQSNFSKTVSCNCKKSRCLKLYCDCFRVSTFCDGCNCVDCANNLEHSEGERAKVINSILERNPDAFKPRVMANEHTEGEKSHLSGCHCKKSACLKKYCECFTGGVPCSAMCRCIDCKNSHELYSATGELIGASVVHSSTKKVNNNSSSASSKNNKKNDEELNNSRESTSSPINTLLELAGAGAGAGVIHDEQEREATESLLALSPKPSRSQISDMHSSQSDAEESVYKTSSKNTGALFI